MYVTLTNGIRLWFGNHNVIAYWHNVVKGEQHLRIPYRD
jgi:hypothetical protein